MLMKRSTEERLAALEADVKEIRADRSYWIGFFREAKADRADIKKEVAAVKQEVAAVKQEVAEIKNNMVTKTELKVELDSLYDRIRGLLIKKV